MDEERLEKGEFDGGNVEENKKVERRKKGQMWLCRPLDVRESSLFVDDRGSCLVQVRRDRPKARKQ